MLVNKSALLLTPNTESAVLQLSDSQHVNVRPLMLLGHVGEQDFVTDVTPSNVTDDLRQYLFSRGKHGDGK
jgi:hypothetical protein